MANILIFNLHRGIILRLRCRKIHPRCLPIRHSIPPRGRLVQSVTTGPLCLLHHRCILAGRHMPMLMLRTRRRSPQLLDRLRTFLRPLHSKARMLRRLCRRLLELEVISMRHLSRGNRLTKKRSSHQLLRKELRRSNRLRGCYSI